MKKSYIIFTLLFALFSFGQNSQEHDCPLQADNEAWKIKFRNSGKLETAINLVKEKIKSDSIYSKYQPIIRDSPTITYETVNNDGKKCGCKILFLANYAGKEPLRLDLNSNPKLSSLMEKLIAENVVDFFFGFVDAEAIYGASGKCGFVQLNLRNKKLYSQIKKTML